MIIGWSSISYDLISLALSVILLVAYHVYLNYKIGQNPAYTVQAVNVMARTIWVETIMHEGKDILAVQTLRNSTMAATFLASTAVLLIIGVLTLTGRGNEFSDSWHALNMMGGRHTELLLAKLLLMLLDLFVAFFSFSMSIRLYNHVGFMINVPLKRRHKIINPQHVAIHLNRAGKYYSIGMRAYYFLLPQVFWLFGPHFMLAASVGLIFALYQIDRAPKSMRTETV
ncbi:hypothetical protein SKTS_17600 [Sulfurimicrobium lacus]|uniref:DUF599 domain-containing protein n=1 Tax=Sulfurimicrobium lacus TaxID=2715678 RepID=A0A6F8VB37_9PROT|nr:DUF599 domain-containing protein [Sulfurimicrobium lacus]BCB26874.1 hypothetical protein SKTS_17600 [Sulfurimicrobium lacus]